MKIGILTHFGSFQASYALHVGWLERAKLLKYHGQDFDFLVNEKCTTDIYPNIKKCLKGIGTGKSFEDRVAFFEEEYLALLDEYDVILTADLMYQCRGNFLPQNQAIRNVIPELKARWFHWVHSAWTTRPVNLPYPLSLRHTPVPKSVMVYMNESEKSGIKQMYATEDVKCVYNAKDFRSFNNCQPVTWEITKKLDIPNKDIVQVLPLCSTRMDAKGIDSVIRVFAALKLAGQKIALVIANSNGRHVKEEILKKKAFIYSLGLNDNDFLFTSDITDWKPLPREAVADLFKISNLFVFASWREVCPNVLLEAKINGNLLCVNKRTPWALEFAGDGAVHFEATHKTPGVQDGGDGDMTNVHYDAGAKTYFEALANELISKVQSRSHLWEFSYEKIWHNQFKGLLND